MTDKEKPRAVLSRRITAEDRVADFFSGDRAVDDWLRRHAAPADAVGTVRTYLWLENEFVIGYYTISPHKIRRLSPPDEPPRTDKDTIPAILIARLALASTHQGRGLSTSLFWDAVTRSLQLDRRRRARLVLVDAPDASAAEFYATFGFRSVPGSPHRLVIARATIESAIHGG